MSGTGDLNRMYSQMKIDNGHFKTPATRSMPYYLPKMKSASHILLVHNTFMEEADLIDAQALSENLFFCFCPNANRYIEDRLPDIPVFLNIRPGWYWAPTVWQATSSSVSWKKSKPLKMSSRNTQFPHAGLGYFQWGQGSGIRRKLGDFKKGKKPGIVLLENTEGGEISANSTCRRLL